MTCAIMQPTFFPWLGYFDLIDQSDCFVIYDDVQLVKRSWQVRNRIKTSNGELFLTIPIKKTKHRDDLNINQAEINHEEKWGKTHLKSLEMNYRKTVHFEEVYSFLEDHYMRSHKKLCDFNYELILKISRKIGIDSDLIKSSEIQEIKGKKEDRLISICTKLKMDTYLSPKGSSIYLEEDESKRKMKEANIKLTYHAYNHPEYVQLYGAFLPFMSVADLLFNVGFANALTIIKQGRE